MLTFNSTKTEATVDIVILNETNETRPEVDEVFIVSLSFPPVTFSINVSSQSPDFLKELKVSAHGPSADAAVMLKPNGSGELQATVTPTEAGKYDIMAVYQGENISGSLFPLPVADPSKCQIFGDIPRYMQVGKPQEITVKARGAGIGSLVCNCSPSSKSSPSPLLAEVKETMNT